MTDDLQSRIAARQARLTALHARPPRNPSKALEALGPYVQGEPQAISRKRAAIKRLLGSRRGQYAPKEPLPRGIALARQALAALGSHTHGESGYVSRRRAALLRAFPALARQHIELQLAALGPPDPDEYPAVTKARKRHLASLASGM